MKVCQVCKKITLFYFVNWLFMCKLLNYSQAGADLEGGAPGMRPLYFFAEIGRLTLCGRSRQKECTKLCKLTLKINIFLRFWRGTSSSDTPSPQVPKFCQSLNLAPPLLKYPGSAPDKTKTKTKSTELLRSLWTPLLGCAMMTIGPGSIQYAYVKTLPLVTKHLKVCGLIFQNSDFSFIWSIIPKR